MAQFAYNTLWHSATGLTLFFSNYGFTLTIAAEPRELESYSAPAEERVELLWNIHQELRQDAKFLQGRIDKYYN
jgi:hypothetical protein